MTVPALVPTPTSLIVDSGAPFVLSDDVEITGDAAAVAMLRADIDLARTGGAGSRAIALTIEEGGPAQSYRLAVDAASVAIVGADAAGLHAGIQTLLQLVDAGTLPAVRIVDEPRFAYRGVMLDVARHFHGVETVQAYIDRASSLKFNVLHLHLSDDQGWRLEILSRPELTARASATAVGGDAGGFFTQADYRAIVDYAAARHMIVVPEIDVPGHTHAVSLAYPALSEEPVLSAHVHETIALFGGDLPANGTAYEGMAVGFSSLKIHDEATYDFLRDVFGEVAALTPGPYLHFGGDEALGTDPADFALFVARASALVAATGKIPVAWHEAGSATDLAPGTIGHYWGFLTPADGSDDTARRFVAGGGQLILSPADAIYLDMKFSADSALGLTWANGPTSARRAYEWDPAAVIDGIGDGEILGIEAPLWTETVRDLADIDALAFPRIAAAAEAAWSAPLGSTPERTWESFRTRVTALEPLWAQRGIGFTPLGGVS